VRWWVIVLFVAIGVAVFRYRQRHPKGTSVAPKAQGESADPPVSARVAKFQWGDAVTVATDEGGSSHPGARAMVMEVADAMGLTYRVEFADGTHEVLPESALEPVSPS
jgi:hypothetical protein